MFPPTVQRLVVHGIRLTGYFKLPSVRNGCMSFFGSACPISSRPTTPGPEGNGWMELLVSPIFPMVHQNQWSHLYLIHGGNSFSKQN